MVIYSRYLPVLATAISLYCGQPLALRAQGFSQGILKSKKTVTLHRKLPATVHLKGGTLSVKSTSHEPKNKDAAQKLEDTLQAELLKYNNQFRIDDNKPDTLVICNVTDLLIPGTKIISRSVNTSVKVGNKYQMKQQNKQFQEVNGTINVAYEVKEAHSGKVLDASNLVAKYHQEFDAGGNKTDESSLTKLTKGLHNPFDKKKAAEEKADETPPTIPELQQILVSRIVSQVAARLTNTDEKVDVELARGSALDQYNDFAEKGLWNRMLEPLETMKPLDTPEDDSFRLYNIGVGYEALAYAAEEVHMAKKYLDEAAVNYGKAVDANPHEKEFLDAQNRISTAQAHYAKLGSQAPVSKTVQPAETPATKVSTPVVSSASAPSAPVAKSSSADGPLNNAQVIDFVKNGMDEENLIAIIKEAPKTDFDLSASGINELLKGGIKGKVLTAIRSKAHPAPAHRATTPAKAPVAKAPAQ